MGHHHDPTPNFKAWRRSLIKKTQRVKLTQYDPLYLLSTKKQLDSNRDNSDKSNMFKEKIIKEMF